MGNTEGGIGGAGHSPIHAGGDSPEVGKPAGGPSGASIEEAMHAPVKSLDQLKQMLIKTLGKKDGTKLYNTFMKSLAMQILGQIQHSAAQAKQAAQRMRQGPQG